MKADRGMILAVLATSILAGIASADYMSVTLHRVKLTLNDGAKMTGYVLWGVNYGGARFDPKRYLEGYRKAGDGHNQIELIKTIYPINDNMLSRGIAYLRKDLAHVDAGLIAEMVSKPDKYEGWDVTCGLEELSRERISMMQNPVVFTDTVEEGTRQITAFCYDRTMTRKQLHQILRQYIRQGHSERPVAGPENPKPEVKPQEVVIYEIGCR